MYDRTSTSRESPVFLCKPAQLTLSICPYCSLLQYSPDDSAQPFVKWLTPSFDRIGPTLLPLPEGYLAMVLIDLSMARLETSVIAGRVQG